MRFAEATAVTGGPARWRAELAEGWDIFGISNGGYLLSIMTRAMAEEADGRQPISVTGHFLNPATPGPVDIDVKTLKKGRALSTMRSTMSRQGKPLMVTTAVFGDPDRPRQETRLIPVPPRIPSPDDCLPVEPARDAPLLPPFSGKVDLRIHPHDAAAFLRQKKSGDPRMRGWFRLLDDELLDPLAVILATDAFPPAIYNSDLAMGWTPTVEMTIQIRQHRPRGWLQCQFTTNFVTDGLLEEDGDIWDENGRPVALSRQLALVPQ